MSEKKPDFALLFPENETRKAGTYATPSLSFDDLGEFIEERDKIKRTLESISETELKVDFSDFANHVFFDSAESKAGIAISKILNSYPYNGTLEEKDAFALTGSLYESYVFQQWPKHVGYAQFNGTTQYISATDPGNDLLLGSSSFYVSAHIKPAITNENVIVQVVSASDPGASVLKSGYELYLSGVVSPHLKFTVYSGSEKFSISSAFNAALLTGSFVNVAAWCDPGTDRAYLFINDTNVTSSAYSLGSIEFRQSKLFVGSGSRHAASSSLGYYSGSIGEVRILHTSSHNPTLWHARNYGRQIHSEPYVRALYTFNEGITETASIDSVVVDYSKYGVHGKYLNYSLTDSRFSGSCLINDVGDPILYNFHSSVVNFTSSMILSASTYDDDNANLIFNLIPEKIIEEDDNVSGLYRAFSLAMARYIDELKLYIDQFENLRVTNYDDVNQTPDLMLPMLKKYFGWKVTEHFGDASPLSFFFGEGVLSSGSLGTSLFEIRNNFWKRILNNLPYLIKTKGKRTNIDSFLNVVGVGRENAVLKEFGYLAGGSLEDARIYKQKAVAMLGIGTGSLASLTGAYIKSNYVVSGTANNTYTVESWSRFPHLSAAYSASVKLMSGAIWQFTDYHQLTGAFTLLWNTPSSGSVSGKLVLTSSDGQRFSSSNMDIFDGNLVYVAAGLKSNQRPFIEVRVIDGDRISVSGSFVGTVSLTGVFTGSKWDFVMGANSGSKTQFGTHGHYGEYRFWNRELSGSEINDHALNFESVGSYEPFLTGSLKGHWQLHQVLTASSAGVIDRIIDFSRNNLTATGSGFQALSSPYNKFLMDYNPLSPNFDLKWTENKIRIRNKTELKKSEIAEDTNEVTLEFNLVDALNEDISKIFSTFESFNNAIGSPVNKYRDEYADLEAYRSIYFNRLGDSLNFTKFFKLFRWFDRRLSDSIKQLLPARVNFIGGEQVIESHALERPKYQYKYPIFHTPVEIPEIHMSGVYQFSGAAMGSYQSDVPAAGTYVRSILEKKYLNSTISERPGIVQASASLSPRMISGFRSDKDNNRYKANFNPQKTSGDNDENNDNSDSSINQRNEFAKRLLMEKDRDNT